MHVLVVEPDQIIAEQLSKVLINAGNSVQIASTAETGVQSVDEKHPDVIVLELALGSHNGLEFLYELRSYADVVDVPIILYTYVSPQDFTSDEKVLSSFGIAAYIQKTTGTLKQVSEAVERIVIKDRD